ncbi:hypothetical protein BDW59DRAFT_167971 [Aspergillus cavernicola]|uniref:Uncharacterized protein n=1 Tax=Aspergillus cavernicola TaxID=176166 RepID=A0ABR4H882_9EURO
MSPLLIQMAEINPHDEWQPLATDIEEDVGLEHLEGMVVGNSERPTPRDVIGQEEETIGLTNQNAQGSQIKVMSGDPKPQDYPTPESTPTPQVMPGSWDFDQTAPLGRIRRVQQIKRIEQLERIHRVIGCLNRSKKLRKQMLSQILTAMPLQLQHHAQGVEHRDLRRSEEK